MSVSTLDTVASSRSLDQASVPNASPSPRQNYTRTLADGTVTELPSVTLADDLGLSEVQAFHDRAANDANKIYNAPMNSRSLVDFGVNYPEFLAPKTAKLITRKVFRVHIYLSSLQQHDDDEVYHMASRVGWLRVKRDDGPLLRHKVELHGSMLVIYDSPDAEPAAAVASSSPPAEPRDGAESPSTGDGEQAPASEPAATPAGGEPKPAEISEPSEAPAAGAGVGAGAGQDSAVVGSANPIDSSSESDDSDSESDSGGVVAVDLNTVTNFRVAELDLESDEAVKAAKESNPETSLWSFELVTPRGSWTVVLGVPGPELLDAVEQTEEEERKRRESNTGADPEVASKKKLKELKKLKRKSSRNVTSTEDSGEASGPSVDPAVAMITQFKAWVVELSHQVPKGSVGPGIQSFVSDMDKKRSGMEGLTRITIPCTENDTTKAVVAAALDKLSHLSQTQRRQTGSFVLKVTGKRDYAITKTKRVLELQYVQDALRENQDIEFSLVRLKGAPTRRISLRRSVAGRKCSAADLAVDLQRTMSQSSLASIASISEEGEDGSPSPSPSPTPSKSPRGESSLSRLASLQKRRRSLASVPSSSELKAKAKFVEFHHPPDAVPMYNVKWPFRVRICGVENVKSEAQRVAIVHGEEVISVEPLPVKGLYVQVQLMFGGSLLPGCDMETRTVPYAPSTRWMQPDLLQTDLGLRDIPPDSRIVFVLRGVWPEVVEPERLACVAVPLTDFRRQLVHGAVSLKLWPNIVDVERAPPAQNTVHPNPPILHVEFDSFLHPIVSPLYLADAVAGVANEKEPLIERMGWMHKLGKAGRLTSWKRRWFVLQEEDRSLAYFASNLDDKPKGTIDLSGFSVEEADDLNQTYQKIVGSTRKTLCTYAFRLVKKGARTFCIYTDSKYGRREWMDNIARVINSTRATTLVIARKSSGFSLFKRNKSSKEETESKSADAAGAAKAANAKLGSGQVTAGSWVDAITDLIAAEEPLPMYKAKERSTLTSMAEQALSAAAMEVDKQLIAEKEMQAAAAIAAADEASEPAAEAGTGGEDEEDDDVVMTSSAGVIPDEDAARRWGLAALFGRCSNDPGLVFAFALYMAKQHSDENIRFWLEAERYIRTCAPTHPSCLRGQNRLDAANKVFRTYISGTDDIGAEVGSAAPREQKKSTLGLSGDDDFTVGLSGPTREKIQKALTIANSAEQDDDLDPKLFARAQKEIGRPIAQCFTTFLAAKTYKEAVGCHCSKPAVLKVFDASAVTQTGVLEVCAWYRSLCSLKGSNAIAVLEDTLAANPQVDPEYAAQCAAELGFSAVATSFVSAQCSTGRTPKNQYKAKVLDKASRRKVYSSLKPTKLGKMTPALETMMRKANSLAQFLEFSWFSWLDGVPMRRAGLAAFKPFRPAGAGLANSSPRSWTSSPSTALKTTRSFSMATTSSPSPSPLAKGSASTRVRPTSGGNGEPVKRNSRVAAMMRRPSGTARSSLTSVNGGDSDLTGKDLSTLRECFKQDPLYEPNTMLRALIWQHRREITSMPEALPKFLKSVTWCRHVQVKEAHRLLATWAKLKRPVEALELLDDRYGDAFVRNFAVEELRKLSDDELSFVLPQLVQALKYEVHHMSPLALFLLERSWTNPTQIGLQLFWAFKVEIGGKPEVRLRYQLLLDAMVNHSTPSQQAMLEVQEQLWASDGVFASVCQLVKDTKKASGKAKAKEAYRARLHEINEMLPPTFVLPLDTRIEAKRLLPEECKFMSSAKVPLWLVFENADPDGDKILMMFKAGDDLRQDKVTLQLISVMDALWRQAGIDLHLSPYKCVSTWHDGGMLEIVRNAATTAEIQKTYGGKFGAYVNSTFDDWIRDNNPKRAEYDRAVNVFTESAAGYVVATYLMGIGDRHNDNIMVKKSGHYFHIDFGHFLGNFKYAGFIKRERTRFVFTPEMAYVMGGSKSAKFNEFVKLCITALNELRKHGATLINLFTLVVPAGMPELSSKEDINYLRDMLALNMTEEEVAARFRTDMNEALNNKFKRFDNTMHILKHG